MAKRIELEFLGEHFEVTTERVSRERLYGRVRKVAYDEEGKECERGFMSDDGRFVFPKGALVRVQDNSPEKNPKPEDDDSFLETQFNSPLVFREVEPSMLLDCITENVYLLNGLDPASALAQALNLGKLLATEIAENKMSFILKNGEGVFMLKTERIKIEFIARDAPLLFMDEYEDELDDKFAEVV